MGGKEGVGSLGGVHGVVAVAGEFDVQGDPPWPLLGKGGRGDFAQGGEDGGEVDVALAEGEMVVKAAAHVLDVEVEEVAAPFLDTCGDGAVTSAMDVADVEGEAEEGVVKGVVEIGEAGGGVDEHAGFGLEGQTDVAALGGVQEATAAVDEAGHGLIVGQVAGLDAGPEGDGIGVEGVGHVDGAGQEVEAEFTGVDSCGYGCEKGFLHQRFSHQRSS